MGGSGSVPRADDVVNVEQAQRILQDLKNEITKERETLFGTQSLKSSLLAEASVQLKNIENNVSSKRTELLALNTQETYVKGQIVVQKNILNEKIKEVKLQSDKLAKLEEEYKFKCKKYSEDEAAMKNKLTDLSIDFQTKLNNLDKLKAEEKILNNTISKQETNLKIECDKYDDLKNIWEKNMNEVQMLQYRLSMLHREINDSELFLRNNLDKVEQLKQLVNNTQNISKTNNIIKYSNPVPVLDALTGKCYLRVENHMISCEGAEYDNVGKKFMTTTQDHFKIFDIKKLINPRLMAQYGLRKIEHNIIHDHSETKEKLLFRGVHQNKLDEIIQNGFSTKFWNKKEGISFTTISNHANRQCGRGDEIKYMVVARVLVCDLCDGKEEIVPRESKRNISKVYTKYNEDCFYPSYIIEFSGNTIPKKNIK